MNSIKRTNYLVNELLMEKNVEQSIDMSMRLPDYCGDVNRILQCFAFPNIHSESVSDRKIQIEGTVLVRVLYLSDGEIYAYEQSEPFSKSVEHNGSEIGAVLDVSCAVQYVNCTAASSRKMDIHGAFVMRVCLHACRESSVIESVEESHIQLNKDSLSACSASGSAAAMIEAAQVVDIGSDKPPMKSIIRNTAVPILLETKQVSGKILIKGELKIKTLYKSEADTVEALENTLPLSQILDVEGLLEESTVDIKLQLAALDIAIKPSALGSMSLLDMEAKVDVSACAFNCIEFPVLKDCYSTQFGCECNFKNVSVDRIVTTLSKSYMHKIAVEQLSDVARVMDVWCDGIQTKAKLEEGQLVFFGSLDAYVLYEDTEGVINLKSAQSEFRFAEALPEVCNIKCEPKAVITGCDYIITPGGVEIRADIQLRAIVFECISEKVVDEITLSEEALPKTNSLFIYYPKAGESLWDIARRYKTTVAGILKENDISEESIAGERPLLIWA